MQKTNQEIALCGAPPGGCGFRGRAWRKGQLVAGYSTMDGTPYCSCGSQMRSFQPRRFVALDAAQQQSEPDADKRCDECDKRIGDGDDDCGYCINCHLPSCVHDDRFDVEGDGNVCPRACNALSPHGEVCDDTIAHEGQHRWPAEAPS